MNKISKKKTIIAKAISNTKDKTAVVIVERTKNSKLYSKKYSVSKKYKVHNPENNIKIGDIVEIMESRPISKSKSYTIVMK